MKEQLGGVEAQHSSFLFFPPVHDSNLSFLSIFEPNLRCLKKKSYNIFFSPLVLPLGFTIITFTSFNLSSRAVPSISVHVTLPFNQPDESLAFINDRAVFRLRYYSAVVEFCNISWKRKIFSSDTLDSHLYLCPHFLFHFSAFIQCRAPLRSICCLLSWSNLSSTLGIIYCKGLCIIRWSDIIHKRPEIT